MPIHNFSPLRGRRVEFTIDSEAVKNNILGDPTTRRVAVYLPEGYDDSDETYPVFVDLVGFTGSGLAHFNWRPFGDNIPQRLDRLVAAGTMGPVVTVFPDCFTSLGGNQYINSAAMGNWEDFLIDEMLPEVEKRFRVKGGRDHRAVFGKSSGGYGAIVHGLRRADAWGAVACHSGDMGFLLCYLTAMPQLLDTVNEHGGIAGLLAHFETKPKLSGDDTHRLMDMAMAATYDPDVDCTERHPPAARSEHRRTHRGALGQLDAPRPGRVRQTSRSARPICGHSTACTSIAGPKTSTRSCTEPERSKVSSRMPASITTMKSSTMTTPPWTTARTSRFRTCTRRSRKAST